MLYWQWVEELTGLLTTLTFLVLSALTWLVSLSPGNSIEQFTIFSSYPLTKILSSLLQHVCRYVFNEDLLKKEFFDLYNLH